MNVKKIFFNLKICADDLELADKTNDRMEEQNECKFDFCKAF